MDWKRRAHWCPNSLWGLINLSRWSGGRQLVRGQESYRCSFSSKDVPLVQLRSSPRNAMLRQSLVLPAVAHKPTASRGERTTGTSAQHSHMRLLPASQPRRASAEYHGVPTERAYNLCPTRAANPSLPIFLVRVFPVTGKECSVHSCDNGSTTNNAILRVETGTGRVRWAAPFHRPARSAKRRVRLLWPLVSR